MSTHENTLRDELRKLATRHERTTTPAPDAVRELRARSGLTQTEAAQLVHAGLRTWQQWEAGDREMPPAAFELFRLILTSKDARQRLARR